MADPSPRRAFVTAVGIGVALGSLSAWFDGLPRDLPIAVLAAMANAIGPWIIGAFAAGSRLAAPRRGALAGFVALGVGVVAYYVALPILYGPVLSGTTIAAGALWLVAAAIIGPVYGGAGSLWSAGDGRWRVGAVALLSGGLLAEAIYRVVTRAANQVAIVDGVLALVAPLVLLGGRDRLAAYGLGLVVGLVGAVGIGVGIAAMQTILFGRPV